MNYLVKELWERNYRGEGLCSELVDFVKTLDFSSKKGATYLPWATVERIFKLQGGRYEVLEKNNTIVEIDEVFVDEQMDAMTGEMSPRYNRSYFVNIAVEWQGESYVERYPLQSSTGQALTYWTQNDLNKSVQRGKVKAIAIISGIGYKLFEDGDLQFDVDEKPTVIPDKIKEPTTQKAVAPKPTPKIVVETPTPKTDATIKTKPVTPKTVVETPAPKTVEEPVVTVIGTPVVVAEDEPTDFKTTLEKAEKEELRSAIKTSFVQDNKRVGTIVKNFLAEHNALTINDLSDYDLQFLHELVV